MSLFPPKRYVVSRFTAVSWRDGEVLVSSALSGTALAYADGGVLDLLSAFAAPRAVDDADDARTREWIDAGILVDADAPEPAAMHHWDRESLALHMSSRYAKWQKKRVEPSAPAIAPRHAEEAIALAPRAASGGLATLLEARRSRRNWSEQPIGFQAFSDLFVLSARNRPTDREAHLSRPYPSGGAAYSLELYPVLGDDAVDTLPAGIYRYLPEAHALEVIAPAGDASRRILRAAGNTAGTTPPPVAIVITSRYARQSAQYTTLAYSLVLKEVGCLFQTFYLAAESLGLAACALGRGTPSGLLAGICGTTEIEEPVVGEFAIG